MNFVSRCDGNSAKQRPIEIGAASEADRGGEEEDGVNHGQAAGEGGTRGLPAGRRGTPQQQQ